MKDLKKDKVVRDIKRDLATSFIGEKIYYYDSIDSTNSFAKKIASKEREGTIVIAEEQVDGRGRFARKWISPKNKGIWMTIILKPSLDPREVGILSLLGAGAIYKGLKNMGIASMIKWPNDILMENKKIGGILVESSLRQEKFNYLVMGMGINVNLDIGDLPEELRARASSIKIEEGGTIDREKLICSILNELEKLYIYFDKTKDSSKLIKICKEASATIGRDINLISDGELKEGRALDINHKGELVVRLKDKSTIKVSSGEVSIRNVDI